MAVLRFRRDKRGYEYFSLIEPGGRGKGGRLLYCFRTPPNVKLGRSPFDKGMQRAIESQNPGIRFDWPRILSTPIPSAEDEMWRERRRAAKAAKVAAARDLEGEVAEESGETAIEAVLVEPTADEAAIPDELKSDEGPSTGLAEFEAGENGGLQTLGEASASKEGESPRRRRRRRRRRRASSNGQPGPEGGL